MRVRVVWPWLLRRCCCCAACRLLGQGASRLLLTQPQLILSVMNNAPLSLW